MNVTLTQLEYLLAVDRYRHFGKAAKASHVTQPTLSMGLAKLEEGLGFSLFDRSKKPIVPTEHGLEILQQARRILEDVKGIESLAKNVRGIPSGELRLAVIPTLAPYLVPRFVPPFTKSFARIRLLLSELQTAQIIEALEADTIDAAILATPLDVEGLTERILFYESFWLYANPSHPLAERKRIREEDLQPSGLWLLKEGHCFRNQVIQLCGGSFQSTPAGNVSFEAGALETVVRLVDEMGGYTLVPYLAAEQLQLRRGKLLGFQKPWPARQIALVCRRRNWKADILEALSQTILKAIPEELRNPPAERFDVVSISQA